MFRLQLLDPVGMNPPMHRPLSSVLGESKVMWLSSCEGPAPQALCRSGSDLP